MSQKRATERYKDIVRGAAPILLLALSCTPKATGGPGESSSPRGASAKSSGGKQIPAQARARRQPASTPGAEHAAPKATATDAFISPQNCKPAAGLPGIALPSLSAAKTASRGNLQTWVDLLASSAMRGRRAGTRDSRRAAALIADQFAQFGAQPPSADGYCAAFSEGQLTDQNVVAHIAPARAECPWVVVGAHYDALGTDKNGVLYPGADDNATGVAVLLELARLIQVGTVRPKVGVALVAFGAEEADLTGSRAYVKRPSVPLSSVSLMINVDMAGRKPAGYPIIGYEVYGRSKTQSAHRVRMAAADARVRAVAAQLGDRSDSASFAPHVPTVFFCTMVHADYHKPTDTPDRVDFQQTMRALRLVTALVESVPCSALGKR